MAGDGGSLGYGGTNYDASKRAPFGRTGVLSLSCPYRSFIM